jgi:hypothetical protein
LKRNEKWVRLLKKLLYLKAAMHGGNKKKYKYINSENKHPEKT